MQNNSQNSANSNSTFYEKAKGAHHTANAVWMWLKIIGVVTLVIIAGYALWKLYHSFNVEEVKTQSFTMNEWKAVEAQKVIIGENIIERNCKKCRRFRRLAAKIG